MNNNKFFWAIIILMAVFLVFTVGSKFLISKVADEVIIKLQKDYSPSPYGPGINPDKLDPEKIKKSK